MSMRKTLTVLLLFMSLATFGQDPKTLQTSKTSYVTDLADVYTPEQKAQLDAAIRTFSDTVQFAVVTTNDLAGLEIEDYAVSLFNDNMHVGSKSNNGVLIVICPSCHKIRTATGPGVQGTLTDLMCGKLQKEHATPHFKQNEYFEGTYDLIDAYMNLMSPARQEIYAAQQQATEAETAKAAEAFGSGLLWFLCIAGAFGFIFWQVRRINRNNKQKERDAFEKKQTLLRDFKSVLSNIRTIFNNIKGAEKFPEYDTFVNRFNADPFLKNVSVDDKPEDKGISELQVIVDAYTNFMKGENKSLYDTMLRKLGILKAAKEKLNFFDGRYFEGQNSACELLGKQLNSLVFTDTKYDGQVISLTNILVRMRAMTSGIEHALNTGDTEEAERKLNLIDALLTDYRNQLKRMQQIVSEDNDKKATAIGAKQALMTQLRTYGDYCSRPGVSEAIAKQTRNAVNVMLDKLNEFNNIELVAAYKLYDQLSQQIYTTCQGAKNANAAYEAEQARIRKEKQDAIDAENRRKQAIIDEENRRQRAIRDEEERRQRAIRDENDRQYRAAQQAAEDSRRSSESSNSISFGGGSTDGGGATSDW